MGEISRVLASAARRLFLSELLRGVVLGLCVALGALIVLRVSQQMFGFALEWPRIGWYAALGAAAAGLAWAAFNYPARATVARRVDEGADLREALSTALCVADAPDGWARAVVASASERARTVDVRKAVPIRGPRFWPAPLALGLSFLVVYLALPSWDVLGWKQQAQARVEQAQQVELARQQADEATRTIEEAAAKFDPGRENPDAAPSEPAAPLKTPEEIKLAAVKKLTDLTERLEQVRTGEQGRALDELKDMLRQLKPSGPGPLSEVNQSLAKGDFRKASEDLQQLATKLAAQELSPKQQEQLAEQMKKLAAQLDKLAENQQEMERKLAESGLDKKLAADPDALRKALESATQMSPEQKQQLMQAAKAMKSASSASKSMSQCMNAMASGMRAQGLSQEGMDGLQGMMAQLSKGEMMASDMASLEATLNEAKLSMGRLTQGMPCNSTGLGQCEGGLVANTKPWQAGQPKGGGAGQGGPGTSRGGGNTGTAEDVENWEKRKFHTPTTQGPIIGTMLIEGGEQIKGESQAAFAQAVAAASQASSDAIETNVIPREYQDAVKHYFGRLQAKAGAGAKPSGKPPAEKPAAPAPAPK
ncbi:MAG: hypothetical protein JNM07_04445 [Phycisphaerae bacterium]|nr:hypothetical protein [Phycisphaerae bacterium]